MAKNEINNKRSFGYDDSELVAEIRPLALFRSSSLEFEDEGEMPTIRPCYTVVVNPKWLDDGGEVELCIAARVRIVSKGAKVKTVADPLIQIVNGDGQYDVLILKEGGLLESALQLKPVLESAEMWSKTGQDFTASEPQ
jgi:hypothetical protein